MGNEGNGEWRLSGKVASSSAQEPWAIVTDNRILMHFGKKKKYKITIKRKFNLVRNFNPLESVK